LLPEKLGANQLQLKMQLNYARGLLMTFTVEVSEKLLNFACDAGKRIKENGMVV